MAKYKKYPKSPKKSSSLDVWEKHKQKCQEVDKHNAKIDADKKKKETVIGAVKKIKSK